MMFDLKLPSIRATIRADHENAGSQYLPPSHGKLGDDSYRVARGRVVGRRLL